MLTLTFGTLLLLKLPHTIASRNNENTDQAPELTNTSQVFE